MKMKNEVILTTIAIIGILFIGMSSIAFAQTPSVETVTIDLSGTANPNDFLYGIACPNKNDTCYVSVHKQGIIIAINTTDWTIEIIEDATESAAAGKDFYAITFDENENLFVPERDNGEVKKYNIPLGATDPLNAWTRIIVMEQVIHPNVSYPFGYLVKPNLISVSGTPSGTVTQQFSANSFGGITFANGNVWQALNYFLDFNADAESVGVIDVSFNGLVKINPATTGGTDGVSRVPLAGVTDVRGIIADGTDLWITSQADDKLIKFDTITETVTDSITLALDSNPRGLSTDANFIYIALNKPCSGSCGNSEILKVDKTNLASQTIIDTTAPNTNGGTFTTFFFAPYLLWSDESKHIGAIDLVKNEKFVFTVEDSQGNHFMDLSNGKPIVAGKGSALVTTVDTSTLGQTDGGNGKGKIHLTRPTFGPSHINHKQIVQNGFSLNDRNITITDSFHTNFEKQLVNIGTTNIVKAKAFAPNGVKVMEFDFGVSALLEATNAEVKIEFWFDQQQNLEKIQVVQNENLVNKDSVKLVFAGNSNCSFGFTAGSCFEVVASFVFLEQPFNDIMAIHAIDHKLLDQTTYLNEGIDVTGESLNPPTIEKMADKRGKLVQATRVDKFNDIWSDEQGTLFTKNDFETWIQISPVQIHELTDTDKQVNKRVYSYWKDMILLEQTRAKLIFNSDKIQNPISGFFAYDFPEKTDRELLLEKLGWS